MTQVKGTGCSGCLWWRRTGAGPGGPGRSVSLVCSAEPPPLPRPALEAGRRVAPARRPRLRTADLNPSLRFAVLGIPAHRALGVLGRKLGLHGRRFLSVSDGGWTWQETRLFFWDPLTRLHPPPAERCMKVNLPSGSRFWFSVGAVKA